MKKNYALLSGLILASSLGFAQDFSKFSNDEAKVKLSEEVASSNFVVGPKERKATAKVPGTVLYSEDFAGQIPAGWTVTNQAGNSNNWIWANSAPGGQYSSTTAALNSTTASNGFMSLPSDLYNTPFPAGGPVGMDVWFSSPAITIPSTPSVLLQWEQSSRYCCSGADELVVEVSIDNINWTTYDAINGRGANTGVPSPTSDPAEQMSINVSGQLANQTTAYIRFRQTGATHYYWMIDDVALVEGAADAMELSDFNINFSDTTYNPVLSIVPQLALSPLTFTGVSVNAGSNTQTGVGLEVEIVQDSTYAGAPGVGTVSILTTMLGIPVPSLQRDTMVALTYNNTGDGSYRAIFRVLSTATNQNPSAAQGSQPFVVSDTVLAKDLGPYIGDAGPANYVGGGNDGDRWGSMMTVGAHPNAGATIMATSVSILVANVTTNDGASIQPRVWKWEDSASTIANAIVDPPIGSTPFSTLIDTAMLGNWITLPLFPPAALTPGTQYVVGWEQTGGASAGAEFTAARDRNLEAVQPSVTNFVYVNDASPSWGWVTQLAAVRLNFGNLIIGLDSEEDANVDFSVSPNPNNGLFNLNVTSKVAKTYNLSVRNMLGQVVYNDNLSVSGSKTQSMDLTNVEKGLYFVTLDNGSERLVKKVIVK